MYQGLTRKWTFRNACEQLRVEEKWLLLSCTKKKKRDKKCVVFVIALPDIAQKWKKVWNVIIMFRPEGDVTTWAKGFFLV